MWHYTKHSLFAHFLSSLVSIIFWLSISLLIFLYFPVSLFLPLHFLHSSSSPMHHPRISSIVVCLRSIFSSYFGRSTEDQSLKRNVTITLIVNIEGNTTKLGSTLLFGHDDDASGTLLHHMHNPPLDHNNGWYLFFYSPHHHCAPDEVQFVLTASAPSRTCLIISYLSTRLVCTRLGHLGNDTYRTWKNLLAFCPPWNTGQSKYVQLSSFPVYIHVFTACLYICSNIWLTPELIIGVQYSLCESDPKHSK